MIPATPKHTLLHLSVSFFKKLPFGPLTCSSGGILISNFTFHVNISAVHLSAVLFPIISVTHGQPVSENIK
jgi:hypothetical protein